VRQADAEAALRLAGRRRQLQRGVSEQVELLSARQPRVERLLPRRVVLRGGGRLRQGLERRALRRSCLQIRGRNLENLRLRPVDGDRSLADQGGGNDVAGFVDLQFRVAERDLR